MERDSEKKKRKIRLTARRKTGKRQVGNKVVNVGFIKITFL